MTENVLLPETYTVCDPAQDIPAAGIFQLTTQPVDHTLCGDPADPAALTLTPSFNTVTIDDMSSPLSWEENGENTFTVETDDRDLALDGPNYPYALAAAITSAPTADIVSVSSTITFLDPCDALDVYMPTDQVDVTTDTYTGDTLYFNLTPFEVEKAVCADTVTYACSVAYEEPFVDVAFLCTGFDGTLEDENLPLSATFAQL